MILTALRSFSADCTVHHVPRLVQLTPPPSAGTAQSTNPFGEPEPESTNPFETEDDAAEGEAAAAAPPRPQPPPPPPSDPFQGLISQCFEQHLNIYIESQDRYGRWLYAGGRW